MRFRDNVHEAPVSFQETVATKRVVSAQTLLFLTFALAACLWLPPPFVRLPPTYPIGLAQGLLSPGSCPCFSLRCITCPLLCFYGTSIIAPTIFCLLNPLCPVCRFIQYILKYLLCTNGWGFSGDTDIHRIYL